MNPALQAFRAARLALAAFSGGRAPRLFRRDFEAKVQAAAGLRRGTAWLRELAALRPSLRSGPLWGGALAELTGVPPPADGAAAPGARWGEAVAADRAATDRPGRSSPTGPAARASSRPSREKAEAPPRAAAPWRPGETTPGERRGQPRPAASGPPASGPGATPAGADCPARPPMAAIPPISRRDPAALRALAERADRNLLKRCAAPAGGLPTAAVEAASAAPRSPAFPAPTPGSAAGLAPDAAAAARWRREISRRAERAQRSGRVDGLRGAAPVLTARPPMGKADQASGAPPEPPAAAPWQTPLAGEPAPREILDRLRTAGRCRTGAPPSAARPERPESATPEIHPARSTALPPPVAAPAGRADAGAARSGRVPPAASSVGGAARTPAADLAAETGPLLVPPPSLPPFLQVYAATEVALRRPAAEGPTGPGIPPRIPAILPEDDLAARIDRLLAEEARRHGIDV